MTKDVDKSIAKIEKKLREVDEGKWPTTVKDYLKLENSLRNLKELRDVNN